MPIFRQWKKCKRFSGSTEIWTRIAGFKVQSANHYTIEPVGELSLQLNTTVSFVTISQLSKKAK